MGESQRRDNLDVSLWETQMWRRVSLFTPPPRPRLLANQASHPKTGLGCNTTQEASATRILPHDRLRRSKQVSTFSFRPIRARRPRIRHAVPQNQQDGKAKF
jgi:hypothetical protein